MGIIVKVWRHKDGQLFYTVLESTHDTQCMADLSNFICLGYEELDIIPQLPKHNYPVTGDDA